MCIYSYENECKNDFYVHFMLIVESFNGYVQFCRKFDYTCDYDCDLMNECSFLTCVFYISGIIH